MHLSPVGGTFDVSAFYQVSFIGGQPCFFEVYSRVSVTRRSLIRHTCYPTDQACHMGDYVAGQLRSDVPTMHIHVHVSCFLKQVESEFKRFFSLYSTFIYVYIHSTSTSVYLKWKNAV